MVLPRSAAVAVERGSTTAAVAGSFAAQRTGLAGRHANRIRYRSEAVSCIHWVSLRRSSTDRPLGDLADPGVFEDVLYRLSYKLDGTPAAGDTYKRRRRALNTALEHAVVVGELPENPLQGARRKHVGSNEVVDRRVLVNAVQARQLLKSLLRRVLGSLPRAAPGGFLRGPVLRGPAAR